ncbi:MAG: hypothetical protein Q8N53_17545 [Longimicrobiales bacterium]|nr:hypothetical protein [Longimicrobiales bacterium]
MSVEDLDRVAGGATSASLTILETSADKSGTSSDSARALFNATKDTMQKYLEAQSNLNPQI